MSLPFVQHKHLGWVFEPTEKLNGYPPNLSHETDTYGSQQAKLAKENVGGIYLGSTGDCLDSNQTITAGHDHSKRDGRIQWRTVGSWMFSSDTLSSQRESVELDFTTLTTFAWFRFSVGDGEPRVNRRLRIIPGADSFTIRGLLYDKFLAIIDARWIDFTFQKPPVGSEVSTIFELPPASVEDVGAVDGQIDCLLELQAIKTGSGSPRIEEVHIGYL